MDSEQITCVLELAALICYGFLIFALLLYWPNEANVYLVFFCLSNSALAFVAAYGAKEDGEHCRWNGILTLFALTLGFESLYRSQAERKKMARHQFRLYRARPNYSQIAKSALIPFAVAFIPWTRFKLVKHFDMCFLQPTEFAVEETLLTFLWILIFYLRPVIMSFVVIPGIFSEWYKQTLILKHEGDLQIDGKFLLYKDHHRRLFHVIVSMASIINFVIWLVITLPYIIQMICMVAGLNTVIRLEEMSPLNVAFFVVVCKAIPIACCLVFISALIAFVSLKL